MNLSIKVPLSNLRESIVFVFSNSMLNIHTFTKAEEAESGERSSFLHNAICSQKGVINGTENRK